MKCGNEVRLGDYCEVYAGFAFKSSHFTENRDDVPLVKGENVGQGRILWEISKYWPRDEVQGLERFSLRPGDVVLAMDRPWVPAGLKYSWIREHDPESLLVQRVARLRARKGLDQGFLRYVIASEEFVGYVQNCTRGVSVPHVSGRQIEDFRFNLLGSSSQRRIASILSAYDELIENNLRRIALLEEAARLLYREWFVRLRFPGHEHTRIVDGVPEGWERAPLEKALLLQRGFDLPRQDREEGDIPVYASTGPNGCHSKAMVKGPGVVTGRSGTLGVVHYISKDFWPLNTALWVRDFLRVSPFYASFLLRALQLEQYNGGVSVPTLDRKVVHRLPVLLPPPKLIRLFDEQIAPIFTQNDVLILQNEKLKRARDLLLPRLMRGEIAV